MSKILQLKDGEKIAYRKTPGKGPGVIFLGGFMSDMEGTKAVYFEKLCQQWGSSYIRFDYFGHGISSGQFEEGTIGRWLDNALTILDELTEGPQILVGSSMGGWLMCLLAQKRPKRIQALLGIAAAPDFIEDFSRLSVEQEKMLEEKGVCFIPCDDGRPYTITKNLVLEARKHMLLKGPISIKCPVRLWHGLLDTDVSWQKSVELADGLVSRDVTVTLVKDGDHRLASKSNLGSLGDALKSLRESTNGCGAG